MQNTVLAKEIKNRSRANRGFVNQATNNAQR